MSRAWAGAFRNDIARLAPSTSALDDAQLERRSIEQIHALGGADGDVLESNAIAPFEVDPRLDAEGHPRLERRGVAVDEVRVLVAVEPDPMAETMQEGLAVATRFDRVSRRAVDRFATNAGVNLVRRGGVGVVDELIDPQELGVRGPAVTTGHPDGPRRVGGVAAEQAADVEDDGLARADPSVRREMVRRRRVRAGGDDRKRGVVVALVDQSITDLAADLGLGPTDERPRRDLVDHAIGGLGRQPKEIELSCVLPHPELAQGGVRKGEGGGWQASLEGQDVHRPERPADEDRASSTGWDQTRDEGIRIVRLVPAGDAHAAVGGSGT